MFNKLSTSLALAGFLVAGLPALATPVSVSDSTFGTFDASSGTRSIIVGSSQIITDVNLTLDFSKCDDPVPGSADTGCLSSGEEFASEIYFYVISPTGTRVDIVYTYSAATEGVAQGSTLADGTYTNAASSGGRYVVTYDDEAGADAGIVLAGGTFRPAELLSLFDGEDMVGTWTIGMGDSVGADPLAYYSATLDFNGEATVPEPGSLALLGAGLLGLVMARRRRA